MGASRFRKENTHPLLSSGMSRVFAPKSTATGMKSAEIPEPMPLVIEEVTHFSCKVKWTKLNDPKYKYIVEELKGAGDIAKVYAGFGDEYKVEDLESLKSYKLRLTVEIDGNSTTSRSTEWTTFSTVQSNVMMALKCERYCQLNRIWTSMLWTKK